ncbi:acyloxyacyl hydrolase [Zobellella sp. DQSA1]|uniref:acyloxyacyl hydrolase n=1 Tax=Zobellella sp. DQSA1 TaxID=3342386 RepID=UPI0035C0CD56
MNKWSLWLFVLLSAPVYAEIELQVGAGGGDGADRYSLGIGWTETWRDLGTGQLGYGIGFDSSYWELEDDDLVQLSLVPTLSYRARKHDGFRPFVFVGVGPAWISQTWLGPRELSSQFQFSSRAGVGVALEQHSLALEGWHLSNGGLKQPNDGLSSWGVHYRYNF